MPKSSAQFNNAVHALRALAVLMVFAVHLLDSFNTYFYPNSETLNLAMPFVKRFGTFGVELFFVISGYVIMNSVRKYDLREFLLRRLIRIYPLFAGFTLAFFALSWITNFHPHSASSLVSGPTVGTALLNLSFLNIYFGTPALSPNAWSLTFEANFYIFAGLACFFLRGRVIGVIILLLLAMIAFLIAFPIAIYFVVGCLLYALRGLQPSSFPRSLQFAVLVAWCALAATIDHEAMSPLSIALIAASAIFFFVATVPDGIFAHVSYLKWVSFLGTISYSMYLAHPYAYFPMRVLFQKMGLGSLNIGAAAAIYFPTILAAALVASYAVYLLLEVAPYRAAFGEVIFRFRPERDGRRLDQRPSAEERVAPLLGPAQSSPGRMGD
jgi:peptidoglycan/LPS O-acetylase OafA/YrhL